MRHYTEFLNENGEFDRYAWPGGYEIFYECQDNGLLCAPCANEHMGLMGNKYDPQWNVVGYTLSCETDEFLTCDHCGYSDTANKSVHGKFRWSLPETQILEDGEDYCDTQSVCTQIKRLLHHR